MASSGNNQSPRAIIHKQILDEAKDRPNASMEEISDNIPGASTELVNRVLRDYGDPGGQLVTPNEATEERKMTETSATNNKTDTEVREVEDIENEMDELSEKQRETLRQIVDNPEATQSDIGENLGVSASTISRRLSEITGFAWGNREEFVSGLFDQPLISDGHGKPEQETVDETAPKNDLHRNQPDALEYNYPQPPLKPELAHKVIHACMKSDQFTGDEELELIRALFGGAPENV